MSDTSDIATLRTQVREILRRDLKLGPDVSLDDDMPLFNSDADLDSLDMLLLVSSIEKEFGFRIPNEAVGETVFRSVGTLSDFIASHRDGNVGTAAAASTVSDPLNGLPHRPPFRFVTSLVELQPRDSATGVWAVNGSEGFFTGHFPGHPIVPGVLIAEALAQLSGLIDPLTGPEAGGKLAHVDVRFEQPVIPPADILLHSKLVRSMGALQQFEVQATVGEIIVARGSLALHRTGAEAF